MPTTPDEVVERWEAIEGHASRARGRAEDDAGRRARDAARRCCAAHEIGVRAAAVGFDWERAVDVVAKIEEEVAELRETLEAGTAARARAEEEMGDLLFAIANLSRKLGIEPESALRQANDKFTRRFSAMEAAIRASGRSLSGCSLQDMEDEWSRVKAAGTPRRPRHRPQRHLTAGERRDASRAPVGAHGDGAVEVGPPDRHARLPITLEHGPVRVAIAVATPGADDDQVRPGRANQRPACSRSRCHDGAPAGSGSVPAEARTPAALPRLPRCRRAGRWRRPRGEAP